MFDLRLRRPSPAMAVACVAVFLNVAGVAYAVTGGNFILGRSNSAASQTVLTANIGGPALQIKNTSTAQGSTPLKLAAASGHAPFTVNSSTQVTNLNADMLDGLDSSQLQRRVAGACASNQSINAIDATGAVTCISGSPQVLSVGNSVGPFTGITVLPSSSFQAHGGTLSIEFSASGFSGMDQKLIAASLYLCKTSDCSSNFSQVAVASVYTNEGFSHKAMVPSYSLLDGFTAGTYYLGVHPGPNTTMDGSDHVTWQIVEYP